MLCTQVGEELKRGKTQSNTLDDTKIGQSKSRFIFVIIWMRNSITLGDGQQMMIHDYYYDENCFVISI